MLDFTSSLYLGLRHGSTSLEPWDALTSGRPAALQEPCEARAAAGELGSAGRLCGRDAAAVDLPPVLGSARRAQPRADRDLSWTPRPTRSHAGAPNTGPDKGVPLLPFPRHDATQLARLLGRRRGARPLVLCDGVCPGSDSQPPLADYAALAHRHGGWLVIDDTQGLGVFGHSASPAAPYGLGGGGSLQWHAIGGDHVVVGSSLAKGFGVPVALLAGSRCASAALRTRERQPRAHESGVDGRDLRRTTCAGRQLEGR